MPDHSMSAQATRPFAGNKVVMVSNGVSGAGIGAHWADPVCRHTTVSGLFAGGEKRVPRSAVQAGNPTLGGQLREAHRLETACGVATQLLGRQLRVRQPRQLQRNDPIREAAGPHLQMPVVPGPQHGEPQLRVVALPEHGPGEPRDQRREIQRRPDPGQVHVSDPGLDVPAAAAHLVEAGGLHAPLLARAPDHRVEPDVGIVAVLVTPYLPAVVGLDDPGRPVGQRGGKPAVEHVGRLDHVVVDGDQDMLPLAGSRIWQQRHN